MRIITYTTLQIVYLSHGLSQVAQDIILNKNPDNQVLPK